LVPLILVATSGNYRLHRIGEERNENLYVVKNESGNWIEKSDLYSLISGCDLKYEVPFIYCLSNTTILERGIIQEILVHKHRTKAEISLVLNKKALEIIALEGLSSCFTTYPTLEEAIERYIM
jgi:hypothetical protein